MGGQMAGQHRAILYVAMDRDDKERLEAFAGRKRLDVSSAARMLLKEALDREEASKARA